MKDEAGHLIPPPSPPNYCMRSFMAWVSLLLSQHDDREEGSEEKGQSEDEGDLLTEPITGKRRHVRSWRMQEYLQQQDKTLPQKQRKCPYPGCEKQFSSAPGLRYHLRTHSPNARHFCCDRCKKEFKR